MSSIPLRHSHLYLVAPVVSGIDPSELAGTNRAARLAQEQDDDDDRRTFFVVSVASYVSTILFVEH